MNDELYIELLEGVKHGTFEDCRQILMHFKKNGGTQQDAYETLEKLRAVSGINEDGALDVMDVVSGFCSPSLRIWDSDL